MATETASLRWALLALPLVVCFGLPHLNAWSRSDPISLPPPLQQQGTNWVDHCCIEVATGQGGSGRIGMPSHPVFSRHPRHHPHKVNRVENVTCPCPRPRRALGRWAGPCSQDAWLVMIRRRLGLGTDNEGVSTAERRRQRTTRWSRGLGGSLISTTRPARRCNAVTTITNGAWWLTDGGAAMTIETIQHVSRR